MSTQYELLTGTLSTMLMFSDTVRSDTFIHLIEESVEEHRRGDDIHACEHVRQAIAIEIHNMQ